MKLSNFQRLSEEDVDPQFRPLIRKIGYSINNFADQLSEAFNNKITVDDNLNEFIRTIDLYVNSDGTPAILTVIKSSLSTSCRGTDVLRAENLTSSGTYPTNQPFISFTENNRLITINHISGLQANNKWRLTIRATG